MSVKKNVWVGEGGGGAAAGGCVGRWGGANSVDFNEMARNELFVKV